MSSCPQPKPTSNPTLVLPATIHYTLAHNQNLHPTLARLLYPIQCKLAYYTSIYLPTTKTYTRTLHLAAYYTLYTIHYTVYTCLLYYYPLFTCPQQKPTPYPYTCPPTIPFTIYTCPQPKPSFEGLPKMYYEWPFLVSLAHTCPKLELTYTFPDKPTAPAHNQNHNHNTSTCPTYFYILLLQPQAPQPQAPPNIMHTVHNYNHK